MWTSALPAAPPDQLQGAGGAAPGAGLHLEGMTPLSAADLLVSPRKARRACGESGKTLALLDDYSEFFARHLPPESDFVTWTWRDVATDQQFIGKTKHRQKIHGYRTPPGAFRAVHRLLRDCDVQTPSLLAAERVSGCEAVHIHGLTRHLDGADRNAVFVTSVKRFGSIKILAANPAAFPYVCKYLFKSDSCARFDWLDLSGLRCD